jgi:hypothetical protein
MPAYESLRLNCDCAGSCSIVSVTDWHWDFDDGPDQTFMEIYEHVQAQPTLRRRLGVAWAVARGKEPYTHGLCFTDKSKVRDLRDFLTRVIDADAAATKPKEETHG